MIVATDSSAVQNAGSRRAKLPARSRFSGFATRSADQIQSTTSDNVGLGQVFYGGDFSDPMSHIGGDRGTSLSECWDKFRSISSRHVYSEVLGGVLKDNFDGDSEDHRVDIQHFLQSLWGASPFRVQAEIVKVLRQNSFEEMESAAYDLGKYSQWYPEEFASALDDAVDNDREVWCLLTALSVRRREDERATSENVRLSTAINKYLNSDILEYRELAVGATRSLSAIVAISMLVDRLLLESDSDILGLIRDEISDIRGQE